MNDFFKHKTALVETKKIGKDSKIWAYTHILDGAAIGLNTNICDFCFVEGGVIIGNDVTIKCGVHIWDGVMIEDNVFIGPSVVFTNDLKPRSKNKNFSLEKTILQKGCSIGANSTLIAGNVVGRYALVGAGSLVTKDVPDFALVYGSPAVVMGYVCTCGNKLSQDKSGYVCSCGRRYNFSDGILSEQ
jgi:acetyltransferase-like isoleucine patch superfamily enzyme